MNVLKIGGGAGIDHTPVLQNLAERIAQGEQWIVVHGCSDLANQLATQAGYTVQTITSPGGHTSRYTDATMIRLFEQAAAQVNQQITATLENLGVQAVGLRNTLMARRKTAIRAIRDGRQVIIRDDFSGAIEGVDRESILHWLAQGITPVIAPLGMGEEGEALNVDGDLAAAQVAQATGADTLIILSNVPGLLRDVCDPASLITEFSLSELERYASYAAGRMKKKLLAAQAAQVGRVILADARVTFPLDAALNGSGTHIINAKCKIQNVELAFGD